MSNKIGRDQRCPYSSGKKYKKCCCDKKDNPAYSGIANFHTIHKVIRKEARFNECIH